MSASGAWIDVGEAETLASGGRLDAEVDGFYVAVVQLDGALHAFEDRCTHDGESLAGADVERDTTTLWTERLEVGAVDTIANEITFTTSMSATAQTKIGAGWVDLRFAPYADCAGTQQAAWMFVADDTTRVIDGTAATERPIAP